MIFLIYLNFTNYKVRIFNKKKTLPRFFFSFYFFRSIPKYTYTTQRTSVLINERKGKDNVTRWNERTGEKKKVENKRNTHSSDEETKSKRDAFDSAIRLDGIEKEKRIEIKMNFCAERRHNLGASINIKRWYLCCKTQRDSNECFDTIIYLHNT